MGRKGSKSGLREFLIGPNQLSGVTYFRSVSDLGAKLAELPDAKYANPKSTEAFLSQIFNKKILFPRALRNEIIRYLETQAGKDWKIDAGFVANNLNTAVDLHNEEQNKSILSTAIDELRYSFIRQSCKLTRKKHFIILSQAAFEKNRETVLPLVQVPAFALKLIAVPTLGKLADLFQPVGPGKNGPVRKENLGFFSWLKERFNEGEKHAEHPGNKFIFEEDSAKDFNYTYVVESKRLAISIWIELFALVCRLHCDAAPESSLLGVHKKICLIFRENEYLQHGFTVLVPTEPNNAICGASVVALDPDDSDAVTVFSLANNLTAMLSQEESRSWRQLVYSSKTELLRNAKRYEWTDVEEIVVKELKTSSANAKRE